MSTIEKISVSLPAERITDVRAAIAAGDFATTSEVLRDGLRPKFRDFQRTIPLRFNHLRVNRALRY